MKLLPLEEAIDMFAFGVADGKNQFHPHRVFKEHGLWVLRDDPPRMRDPRLSEILANGLSPEETVARVQKIDPGHHALCVHYPTDQSTKEVRKAYRALGYRAMRTEWLFTRDLENPIPHFTCNIPITQMPDAETLAQIPWDAPQRLRFRPRHYILGDETQTCGWVHSIERGDRAWVADLHVREAHRSKGYGKALMARLLHDDRERGLRHSVLVASVDGARIYPTLGYVLRAEIQVLFPMKVKPEPLSTA
jgi:GNAT superfamily N-acetyltransferase